MGEYKKILIIGHKRHGKDTLAEMLKHTYGLKYQSSSDAALDIFLFKKLKAKYGYRTKAEALADKDNQREEWFNEICAYNTPDKTRLAKKIMRKNDIYVGMRSSEEIAACKSVGLFDLVIAVVDYRKPVESRKSFDISIHNDADHIVYNMGTLDDLQHKVNQLENLLKK